LRPRNVEKIHEFSLRYVRYTYMRGRKPEALRYGATSEKIIIFTKKHTKYD